MTPQPTVLHEPLHRTLLRTVTIAVIAGTAIARSSGGWSRWPLASLLAFWITFGGHWVEILFLNGVRARISSARGVQMAARLAVWFVGGVLLGFGIVLTARAFGAPGAWRWPAWWMFGIFFIGVELAVHLILLLRGQPGFFRDRRTADL
jgi:hypothetical protein